MEYEKLIKERKSTRLFSNKMVDDESINKILEAGRIAPTAKNKQPYKVIVVKSEEGIKKIDKCTKCRYNAPVVLIICGDMEAAYSKSGRSYADIDTSIVTTHMMLEATNIGVDNIWIGLFDPEKVIEEFGIEAPFEPIHLMPIGYKAKLCPPSPFHNIKKDLDDLVTYM